MAVLKLKSKGKDVSALQDALNKTISAKLTVDGEFGKLTKAAVAKFQKKNSQKPDGIAGAATLAVIGLGPSLRMPKMKVKDCAKLHKEWSGRRGFQGTGSPDQMAREMIEIKKMLRSIEADFQAMAKESKALQKTLDAEQERAAMVLDEIVRHQKDYAEYVKTHDVENAGEMASGAETLFAIFTKVETAYEKALEDQRKLFHDRFIGLIDKTFS